jgi:uncharacterized protein DUF6263
MLRTVAATLGVLLLALAPAAQAQVKLEHKYVEGTKAKTQTTSKSHQILTINGANVETESESIATTSSSVGKRREDGSVPIEQKTDALRLRVTANSMQLIDFDSANPPKEKDESQLGFVTELLKAVVGSAYTIVLDKQNQFASVEGTQALLDKANDLNETAAKALRSRLEQDKVKQAFEQTHPSFPTILVRKGDTWDRTEEFEAGAGQTLTFERHYEYLGPVEKDGKKLEKIGVKATSIKYMVDPNAGGGFKVDKSNLEIDSSEGTILFDREAGRAVETTDVTRIKGDLTLNIMDMVLPSKLDLTLDISTKRLD